MSPPIEPKDRRSVTDTPGFFKNLVDSMRVGVIVSDHEGYIVYINDTYARFIGMDQEMLVGRHASELPFNSRLHIVAKTGRWRSTGLISSAIARFWSTGFPFEKQAASSRSWAWCCLTAPALRAVLQRRSPACNPSLQSLKTN